MNTLELREKIIKFKNNLTLLQEEMENLLNYIGNPPTSDQELVLYEAPTKVLPHKEKVLDVQCLLYPNIMGDLDRTRDMVTNFCKHAESVLGKDEVISIVKSVGTKIKKMDEAQLNELGQAFVKAVETNPLVSVVL